MVSFRFIGIAPRISCKLEFVESKEAALNSKDSRLNSIPYQPDNLGHVAKLLFSLRFILANIGIDNLFLSGWLGDDLVSALSTVRSTN